MQSIETASVGTGLKKCEELGDDSEYARFYVNIANVLLTIICFNANWSKKYYLFKMKRHLRWDRASDSSYKNTLI